MTEQEIREGTSEAMRGTVKWFDDAKGYGFITPEIRGRDLFVHFSSINSADRYKSLPVGAVVEYTTRVTDRGPCAESVTVIESPAPYEEEALS